MKKIWNNMFEVPPAESTKNSFHHFIVFIVFTLKTFFSDFFKRVCLYEKENNWISTDGHKR